MEGINNISTNKTSGFSKGLLLAFAASLLLSVYVISGLPADLRFKGNLQYMDLVEPVLMKLYIVLGITALLACLTLYAEMKNIKVAIVHKEKAIKQTLEDKNQFESTRLEALDSQSISSNDTIALLADSLNIISNKFNAGTGACYMIKEENNVKFVEFVSGYALPISEDDTVRFDFGEGLIGQAAKTGAAIYLDEIPEGYVQVVSGLGVASPRFIMILPLKKNNEVKGVLEIATFQVISQQEKRAAEKFANEIGERLT